MRIVAGRHKGRTLAAPRGRTLRPTADRTRAALFDVLAHGLAASEGDDPIRGARVLDAFAGTGALGLEALSRGAAEALFLENAPAALTHLRANIAALGEGERARVLRRNALRPGAAPAPAGLVFLDPPYGRALAANALAALDRAGWIAPGAVIVVECGARDAFLPPPGLVTVDDRRYGAARLHFLVRAHA